MKLRAGVFVAVAVGMGAGAAPRVCRASGFLIYDLSGAAIGRGSAVSAGVDEPAAVWFNPAALSFMEGVSASGGGVFVTVRSRFSPTGGGPDTNSARGNFFLPTVFANGAVSDQIAVGMGVYTAFGIGIRWPDDWVGRESAISASLETLAFNPTASFKLDEHASLALGFDAVRAAVDFTNGLPAIVGGQVRLGGGTWGYGFNVAALYRVVPDRLHVAVTYRSRVRLQFNGRADFDPADPDFAMSLADQPGKATITLPDIWTVGVMGRPLPELALSLDANLVRWTSYSRIDITFQSAPPRTIEPDSRDALTFRAGGDYRLRSTALHLRAGLIYDRGAIPSEGLGPGLPDADRIDICAGVGYAMGPFTADLGYLLVYFLSAESTSGREGPEGTYHTTANLLGITLRGSWR
jgi:long-chain fatty acid transport protein